MNRTDTRRAAHRAVADLLDNIDWSQFDFASYVDYGDADAMELDSRFANAVQDIADKLRKIGERL